MRFCPSKTNLSPIVDFFADLSKVVSLLYFFFVHTWIILKVTFHLVIVIHPLFFFWCLEKAVLCDYGLSWVTPLCVFLFHLYVKESFDAKHNIIF